MAEPRDNRDKPQQSLALGQDDYRNLQISLAAVGAILLVIAIALVAADVLLVRRAVVAAMAGLVFLVPAWLINRRGPHAAMAVLAHGLLLIGTIACVFNGGLRAPGVLAFLLSIMVAGQSFEQTTALRHTLAVLTIVTGIAIADYFELLVQAPPVTPKGFTYFLAVLVIAFSAICFELMGGLRKKVQRLDAEKGELTRRVDEIGAREDLLQLVVEHVPAMIFHTDRQGICLFANRHFEAFFGLKAGSAPGRPLAELIGEANSKSFNDHVHDLASSSQNCTLHSPISGLRHVRCVLTPAPGHNGVFAQLQDITDEIRSEALVRAIAEGTAGSTGTAFFRSLTRHLSAALGVPMAALGELTPTGHALHYHAFWFQNQNVDLPEQPTDGTPCGLAIRSDRVVYHPNRVAPAFPTYRELEDFHVEAYYGLPLHDSAGIPVGVLSVMSFQPLRLSDEQVAVVKIFAARAGAELERQRRERELRQSEVKFQQLFQSSPIPVALLSIVDGRIKEVNDALCRTSGLPREVLIGRTSLEMGFWSSEAEREEWRDELMKKGRTHGREVRYMLPSGEPHWVLVSSEIINLAEGPTVMSFLVDVTERKRNEEALTRINEELEQRVRQRTAELSHSNQELEAFAYSVSHDLRTPLRSIDGFSQILLADYGEKLDDEGRSHLQRIRRATQRLGNIIDDLLQLSRVSRQEMQMEPVNLGGLARAILDDLAESEPSRKVRFAVDMNCQTRGDPMLLRILLENLLGNAWKYTSRTENAEIRFGCEDKGGRIEYFVKDNGVGFDMSHAQRLFRPFERLHRTDEFEGTGVGLASAARIVHRHGGEIGAESTQGQGACFYFSLD